MNFRQYEAIYWIGQLGSFHAAARHLRTSQAAISLRVRALERELGAPLFDRVHDGVRPTPRGRVILQYAAQFIALSAQVRRIGAAGALSGRVSFGATSIHALTWLPTLLHEVGATIPNVVVELTVDTSETLRTMLEQGHLDIAVLAGPVAGARVAIEPVGTIENVWVAAAGLGLSGTACTAHDLARHPIISDRAGSHLHAAVLAWFRVEGAEIGQHHGASQLQTRLHLARAGLGVALAARSAAMRPVRAEALVLVETTRPAPQLDYVLACADARLSPAAEAVAELARRLIRQKPDLDSYFAAASIAER